MGPWRWYLPTCAGCANSHDHPHHLPTSEPFLFLTQLVVFVQKLLQLPVSMKRLTRNNDLSGIVCQAYYDHYASCRIPNCLLEMWCNRLLVYRNKWRKQASPLSGEGYYYKRAEDYHGGKLGMSYSTTLHKWIGTLHLDLHEIRCICVSMVLKVVFKAISLSRDKSYENPMYTAFIWSSLNPNSSWFLGFCIEEGVQNLGGKLIVSDLITLNAEKLLVAIEKKWSQHIRSQYSTWILLLILHIQNIYIYIKMYTFVFRFFKCQTVRSVNLQLKRA